MSPQPTHHPLVQLARPTIETYVRDRRKLKPPTRPRRSREAGGRLCHDPHGQHRRSPRVHRDDQPNRGCPGAGGDQQRHRRGQARPALPPVRPAELGDLEIDVSVLYPPEPIDSPDQLDVKQYGVIVERGHRRGLLLPDIPGIDDVATQVSLRG